MTPDSEDDDSEEPRLGPDEEQLEELDYKPDKVVCERWSATLSSPTIVGRSDDQVKRMQIVRRNIMLMAAILLKVCPNSTELDQALLDLHSSQMWALTGISSNEN